MVRNPAVTHGAEIVGIDAPASHAEGDRTDGGEQNERNPQHSALRDEAKSGAAARPHAPGEGAALARRLASMGCAGRFLPKTVSVAPRLRRRLSAIEQFDLIISSRKSAFLQIPPIRVPYCGVHVS